ncbi:MAG TPA: hypothetical protein VLZ77_10340, partial [Acidimicrobiales bacterium]|nr:hypothetical protein [Acidimicrobiales bacterium]
MALFLIRARRRRDGQGAPAGRGRTTGTRRGRAPGPASFSLLTPAANGTHHERPEPRLRWSDDHAVPAGDFQASAIANAALGPDDIPVRGDSSDALAEFALSYDGYAYWDDLPELANRVLQRWTRDRSLPATLDELRGCLFYEQRRWHHFGEDPAGRSARYMWAVVEAIDELVAPGPAAAGAPRDPRPARASEAHVQVLPRPGVVAPGRVDAGVARAVPGPSRPVAPRGGLRPV